MVLNDGQITYLACEKEMITPFVKENVKVASRTCYDAVANACYKVGSKKDKVISYGVSSFGYDLRLGSEVLIFSNANCGVVDPKEFDTNNVVKITPKDGENFIIIPPNSFALAESLETVKMPQDVLGVLFTKSTYARCGLICHTTIIEPGFEGTITLELSNTTPLPMKVYIDEGVTQMVFLEGERPNVTYSDKNGKYQGQRGITLPKV